MTSPPFVDRLALAGVAATSTGRMMAAMPVLPVVMATTMPVGCSGSTAADTAAADTAVAEVVELSEAYLDRQADPPADTETLLIVWLRPDAEPEEARAVEDLLGSMPSVGELLRVDRDENLAKFDE